MAIQIFCETCLFQSEIQNNVKKTTEILQKGKKVGLLTPNPFRFQVLKLDLEFLAVPALQAASCLVTVRGLGGQLL